MSDFGMVVYNPYGQTRLSITDRSFRLMLVTTVGQGSSGAINIPGLSARGGVAFSAIINGVVGTMYHPHNVSVSGDYVYYNIVAGTRPTGPSLVWVFAST